MQLGFVVQRYGPEIGGGAETLARQMAEHSVERGHRVHVFTSCAISYQDWTDHYLPGAEEINGVTVHRLRVSRPRDNARFSVLHPTVLREERPVPLSLQRRWAREHGPAITHLGDALDGHRFDAVDFFTYLHTPTTSGLPLARRRFPVLLHPTAHHERTFDLTVFDSLLRLVDGFAFLSPEEESLVEQRVGPAPAHAVVGVGFDLAPTPRSTEDFRQQIGLGDRPYLVVVGRLDPGKGTNEIFEFFVTYKSRHPGPLALLLVGDPVVALPRHPDVIVTGLVDEPTKQAAIAGARVLVQPSYFESFSMALVEGWVYGVPALVQGYNDVLVGQARRSSGAIPYAGYAEFEVLLATMLGNDDLRQKVGRAGRAYTESNYTWPTVMDRYETLLTATSEVGLRRLTDRTRSSTSAPLRSA